MIRNEKEALAAMQRYLEEEEMAEDVAPIGEPRPKTGRYGVTYHIGFDYVRKTPGIDLFPGILMLCVRASDGKVMEYEEYSYEEHRLRDENDAPKALNRYFSDRYADHVWRLEAPLERVERPSGPYYVATVLHGTPGEGGAPGPAAESVRLFLRIEHGDVFTEAGADQEDEDTLEDEREADEEGA